MTPVLCPRSPIPTIKSSSNVDDDVGDVGDTKRVTPVMGMRISNAKYFPFKCGGWANIRATNSSRSMQVCIFMIWITLSNNAGMALANLRVDGFSHAKRTTDKTSSAIRRTTSGGTAGSRATGSVVVVVTCGVDPVVWMRLVIVRRPCTAKHRTSGSHSSSTMTRKATKSSSSRVPSSSGIRTAQPCRIVTRESADGKVVICSMTSRVGADPRVRP